MSEGQDGGSANSNVGMGVGKIDGDRLDIDDLRELSTQEYDREYGQTQITGEDTDENGKTPSGKSKRPKPKPDGKLRAGADESSEHESSGDEEADIATDDADRDSAEEDEEEDNVDVDSDDEDAGEGGADADGKKYLSGKTKDGKSYKIAKDAEVEIKVAGKLQSVTVQQLIDRASGAINVERENSELGRRRQKFEQEVQTWHQSMDEMNDNLAMINNIATNGTPEELVQYYGLLTNQDPAKLMEQMVGRMIKHAEQLENMTDREREMYSELQKRRFREGIAELHSKRNEKNQAHAKEKAEVESALKEDGLTWDDFFAAANDVKQKLAEGKLSGKFSAMDIVEYASSLRYENSVKLAIKSVDKSLLYNGDFVDRITKVVALAEAKTGKKVTPAEIQAVIRHEIGAKSKGISESLSRKVDRAVKSGKTNSQLANSRNQEKRTDEAVTLASHRERLWGGE